MLILAVDVETNGQEPVTQDVFELGCVLYDTQRLAIVTALSHLFPVREYDTVAGAIHRIPPEWSAIRGAVPAGLDVVDPWKAVCGYMADVIVAHEAICDAPLVKVRWPDFASKPWLCTRADLDHVAALAPAKVTSYRLSHLAADYGIKPIGPWHRALTDAAATAEMAAKHDIAARLNWKQLPKFEVRAMPDRFNSLWSKGLNQNGYRFAGEPKEGLSYPGGFEKHYYRSDLLEPEAQQHVAAIQAMTGGMWRAIAVPCPPRAY